MSASGFEADRALAAVLPLRAKKLLALRESQWFERKSIRVEPKVAARTLVGFANAEGGTLVIGLSEGVVEDLRERMTEINALRRAAINFTEPPVRVSADDVPVVDLQGNEQKLLVFRVAPGDVDYRMRDGDTYMRAGDSTMKLSFLQQRELLYDRGSSNFEAEPAREASVDDLDTDILQTFSDAIGLENPLRSLNARNLLTRDSQITNAGYLLFARNPETNFPNAHVRVIRYRGTVRGEGARQTIEAERDHRITGPLPLVVINAQQLIEEWMPKRRALNNDGRFADMAIVPQAAWLEGLVNAVVHRSYSMSGDHIRFEIFDNRVEVTSPGRFPVIADLTEPTKISRYSRNPRIARVCSDMGITQELGEGIRRIFAEMQRLGLADPHYIQSSASVTLVLRAAARIDERLASRLPRGAIATLEFLEQSGRAFGTGDIAEALHQSRPTTIKQLNGLRDEGLVLWTGKSARDPRASWSATNPTT